MIFKHKILLLFILFGLSTSAQFDSSYVSLTKNKFSVYPLSELHSTQFKLNFNNDFKDLSDNVSIRYKAQNGLYIGFGMSFYRLGIAISFKLPYTNIPDLKYSTAFSFAGGYSYRKFYGEFKTKHYQGLQKETIQYTDTDDDDNKSSVFDINHDIETKQSALNIYYFQSKKYNFDANFKNYNTQLKSAFSFVYAGGLSYFSLDGQLDLSGNNLNSIKKNIQVRAVEFIPGIAFSLVNNNFYFSSIILLGAAYNYNILDFSSIRHNFSPATELRAVLGYNNKNFFGSLSANYDYDYILLRQNNLSIHNLMFNLKLGLKLNSKYLGKIGNYL